MSEERTHHFYVATAKFVFARGNSLVWSSDPIRASDAAELGLRPLILYGLTVAGTPIHWLGYAPSGRPRAFADFVHEAWTSAAGLRGYPDALLINRHIAGAAPGFVTSLTKLGVDVVIAGPTDKHLSASLRVAQQAVVETRFRARKQAPMASVDDLNAESAKMHASHLKPGWRGGIAPRATAARCEAWMSLPSRGALPLGTGGLDWTPGPWLSAWEATLSPAGPLTLEDEDGVTCVRAAEADGLDDTPTGTRQDPWAAKLVVSAWPNDLTGIANAVGLTVRELRWYLAGSAPIPPKAEVRLRTLLGLHFDAHSDDDRPDGPFVLIAHSTRVGVEVYEAVSHGGDLEYAFEPLPQRGPADPSWRYLLFQAYGSDPSVLMVPRGSRTAERLGERFINFEGSRQVRTAVYRDLVSTCARACAVPLDNRAEMTRFAQRQREFLTECCGEW